VSNRVPELKCPRPSLTILDPQTNSLDSGEISYGIGQRFEPSSVDVGLEYCHFFQRNLLRSYRIALDHRLPKQSRAACTERQAEGNLRASIQSAHEHQAGKIDADDQQHRRCGEHQYPKPES
jgi:hypothetical protein